MQCHSIFLSVTRSGALQMPPLTPFLYNFHLAVVWCEEDRVGMERIQSFGRHVGIKSSS
jgi:hypothetical protein